jgi:hypothetical protein
VFAATVSAHPRDELQVGPARGRRLPVRRSPHRPEDARRNFASSNRACSCAIVVAGWAGVVVGTGGIVLVRASTSVKEISRCRISQGSPATSHQRCADRRRGAVPYRAARTRSW